MQEKENQSKTKKRLFLILLGVLVFSIAMLIISVVQIVQINNLNSKIKSQEQQIERLNDELDSL